MTKQIASVCVYRYIHVKVKIESSVPYVRPQRRLSTSGPKPETNGMWPRTRAGRWPHPVSLQVPWATSVRDRSGSPVPLATCGFSPGSLGYIGPQLSGHPDGPFIWTSILISCTRIENAAFLRGSPHVCGTIVFSSVPEPRGSGGV